MEYIDAEVTAITTSHALTPDVDVRQLIPTEQHRIFKERSRLLVRHPEAKIEFSRPSGYAEILDLVEAHAYELSLRTGKLVPMRSRPRTGTRPNTFPRSLRFTRLSSRRHTKHATKGDIYLWVQAKRRELRTTDRNATWADAALAARREAVLRRQQRALRNERRRPLPRRRQTLHT
jgi:TPP-dependent indolepyruvate ferredoxin oxidoreductase alpha subunit